MAIIDVDIVEEEQMQYPLAMSQPMQKASSVWHGSAFVVEAIFLLAFLAITIAVFVQMESYSQQQSIIAGLKTQAMEIVSNIAEEFAVSPVETIDTYQTAQEISGFEVGVISEQKQTPYGILYSIEIKADKEGTTCAELYTSNYVSQYSKEQPNTIYVPTEPQPEEENGENGQITPNQDSAMLPDFSDSNE